MMGKRRAFQIREEFRRRIVLTEYKPMRHYYRFLFLITLLLAAALACDAASLGAAPTPSPQPLTSTITPVPSPTETPAPTPTQNPLGEYQFGQIAALNYARADWQDQNGLLTYQGLKGCLLAVAGRDDNLSGNTTGTVIAGFDWSVGNGIYLLKIGGQIAGELVVRHGDDKVDCQKAVQALLATVHAQQDYAQAGNCHQAPRQKLRIGAAAVATASSYLRSAPLWSDATRIRLIGPADNLGIQIVAGPVCALYNLGEYSYWQVQLSNGQTGWMAEGDFKQYYLSPKK